MNIGVVILAAGMSKRMGKVKQLLPWKKDTVLGTVINLYKRKDIGQIIVMLGYEAETIENNIKKYDVDCVLNEEYKQGMATSVIKGVSRLNEDTDAFLLSLCDTPEIKEVTIEKIISAYKETGAKIVIPTYNKRKGHPVLFSKELFPELINLDINIGARQVVHKYQDEILFVEVDDENILLDIDTWDAYQELLRKNNLTE